MKPLYLLALASGLVLALAGVWSFWHPRPSSPETLAARALSASTLYERSHAATELTLLKGPQAFSPLRRLVAESTDPEVVVIALNGLVMLNDTGSIPLYLAAMNHADKPVREAARDGVLRFYGGSLPGDVTYEVDDSPEERSKVVRRLQEFHNKPD